MVFLKEDNWQDLPNISSQALFWEVTKDTRYIYVSSFDNMELVIRLNNFPDEPAYTLIVYGTDKIHFNDWPLAWSRSDY